MAEEIQGRVLGLESLRNKFGEIEQDVKYNGGRFALRKASNLIRDIAKQNARRVDDPKTAEDIEKNIVVRWSGRTFKRTGNLAFRVGVLGGAKGYAKAVGEVKGRGKANPGGDTFYWRFVEFGTKHSRAQSFFAKTLEVNQNKAINEFVKQYQAAIGRAIKRAKKGKN